MTTPTATNPLIGKICQYKSEHYGKIIFTDWDTSNPPYIRKDGYATPPLAYQGFVYAPYVPSIPNNPATIFSGSFVMPIQAISPPITVPSRTGKENHKAPWKYGMPWTFHHKLPSEDVLTFPMVKYAHGPGAANKRAKLILTPVEAMGFNVKVKNTETVIASCEYLRCLMVNPKEEDDVGAQSVPTTIWVKPDWIMLHTGAETYETDLARSLLDKLRAR